MAFWKLISFKEQGTDVVYSLSTFKYTLVFQELKEINFQKAIY